MQQTSPERVNVLGAAIDSLTMEEAVERVGKLIESGRPHRVTVVNANKFWLMRRDKELAEIVRSSDLIIPEYAVVWGAQRLGRPLRGHVGGIMLLQALLPVCEERGWRPYFLGAQPEVVLDTVRRVLLRHPRLNIAGWHHGYLDAESEPAVLADIRRSAPDILFVAMGSPRQERWIHDHQAELGVPVAIGVGGTFDVLAGRRREAPKWTRHGFEWLYRLAQDPRLLRRYLVTNTWFVKEIYASRLRTLRKTA
jgi:N-acetylglucosaminyldiphosphoundecaprenol N-acetyl-beta-D-mannosaminyltransferase